MEVKLCTNCAQHGKLQCLVCSWWTRSWKRYTVWKNCWGLYYICTYKCQNFWITKKLSIEQNLIWNFLYLNESLNHLHVHLSQNKNALNSIRKCKIPAIKKSYIMMHFYYNTKCLVTGIWKLSLLVSSSQHSPVQGKGVTASNTDTVEIISSQNLKNNWLNPKSNCINNHQILSR